MIEVFHSPTNARCSTNVQILYSDGIHPHNLFETQCLSMPGETHS